MHSTADVPPALRVAVPATITPQWRSRFSGMGAADADDHTVDETTGPMLAPRRCGQHRSTASLTQLSSSCKQRWTRRMPRTQGRDPRLWLYACFAGGSGTAQRTTRCRCWYYRTCTRPRRTTAQRLLWRWLGKVTRTWCRSWSMFLAMSSRNCTS